MDKSSAIFGNEIPKKIVKKAENLRNHIKKNMVMIVMLIIKLGLKKLMN